MLKERNDQIKLEYADFMSSPISNIYSLLLCIEALSYFNYTELFKKIYSLMDNDSCFVFLVVNPLSWRFKLRRFNSKKTNYNEISISDLKAVVADNDMKIVDMQGFNWTPLPLSLSNSRLISVFAGIERILKLGNWHDQSPWLMISVKK